MPDHKKPLRAHWLPVLGLGLAVVAGFGGVAYLAAFLFVGSGILPNTTVAGVSVGGLSRAAAQAKVSTAIANRAHAPMSLKAGDQALLLDPASAGLSVDVRTTVAAAHRRSPNPFSLAKSVFAHHQVPVAVSVDTGKLDAAVTALSTKLVGGGRDGGIRFDGVTPVAVPPAAGVGIDHDKAMAAIRAAYLSSSSPVQLPLAPVQPRVTAAEVERALDLIARPAVAAPVSLVVGRTTFAVSPEVIAKNLTFRAEAGRLVPVVDGHGVSAALGAGAFTVLEKPAKSASFDVSSGVPVIIPSVSGGTVDLEKLGAAIAAVLPQPAPRSVDVPATGVEPSLTTADAEKLGIKEVVSTFTTHHPCCASRVHNIHTIADIVNGAIVMPGATFSLNKYVGPRDAKRGFVEAPMIEDGLFINSVGGGVSQFATTTFNAVFFAGLKDIEHHPHSYYISRYPAGREATVSYPNPNLIFQNDRPTGILITTSYTGTSLTVTFWGTKYYDIVASASARYAPTTAGVRYNTRPDCESASGEPGFQIDVTQTFMQNGVAVKTNHLHTRYDAEPVIICGPPPSPAASSPPGATPAAAH